MLLFLLYGLTCVRLSFAVTCYKCDSVDQPAHCYQTANCQADEICMVSQNPKLNGDLFFNLGCFAKSTCQYFNIAHGVGRRILVSSPTSITKCCDSDNCNKDLLCPGGICGTTTIIPSTTSTNTACLDDDIPICKNSAAVSLVCRDRDLRQHCKKTCGLCPPPTTQQTMVCEDHVIDCNDQSFLSAVCGRPEAQFFCKKSCNKC
ncbi:uncharacterized protein [Mytilus edulis]|uniref:uncharacterized protein n=1 Tax=Mytilus edulis TaxID=6550 RepID=UPI0039EE48C5